MVKGVPTLTVPHKLCSKGKPLTSEQAQLLKLIGERMVEFRVRLRARWDSTTGDVVEMEGQELTPEEIGGADPEDDENMEN